MTTNSARISVAVLADDLIWASRLVAAVERAESHPVRVAARSGADAFVADLGGQEMGALLIDLGGRSYDGVAVIEAAHAAGITVLAVGQHEDRDLRTRARAAGAHRVHAYGTFFTEGPRLLRAWLGAAEVLVPGQDPAAEPETTGAR